MSGLLFSWLFYSSVVVTGLPRWLTGKESACQCRRHKLDPWGREWQPTPVVLPRKSCGQRSQAGLQYHEVEKETKQQQHFCYWQKVFRMLLKLVIKHCYVYKFSHKSRMVCIFFFFKEKGKNKTILLSPSFSICMPPPACSWKGGCTEGLGRWECPPTAGAPGHLFHGVVRFKTAWFLVGLCWKG